MQKIPKDDDFPLSYCAGGRETHKRLETLYERQARDVICAVFRVRTSALDRFAQKNPSGFCDYPDPKDRIAFWDEHLLERSAVVDDFVPVAYLSEFDQGLYGGLFGGEMRFLSDPETGWISSMIPPLFSDLSESKGLTFDPQHPWFRRYVEQMDIFARAADGKFGISHLILIDSLNFAFELVGATKTYLALLDAPDQVAEAIDFAFDLNVAVHEAFFEHAGLVAGGTCSNMAGWMRGRVVSESVDPFHMMSVDDFEKWGRGPVERMFGRFDGGVTHIHGNGRHLLEAVSTLCGLKAIYLGDDHGYEQAFSVLPELKERVGDMPLVLAVEYPDFCEAFDKHELTGGVLYIVTDTPDAEAANRQMDRVRNYEL